MNYFCPDCDVTLEAPTDAPTVRCPGCGESAEQVSPYSPA